MPFDPPPPDAPVVVLAPPRSRVRIAVGAAGVLVLVGLGATVVATLVSPRGAGAAVPLGATTGLSIDGSGAPGEVLVVHVLGAVAHPGVYQLGAGSRVLDAIAFAGGFGRKADRAGVNLAASVTDGEQLLVPTAGAPAVSGPGSGSPGATAGGKVDLNTADEAALETLPRIGPAMAQRIIAFRASNGGFKSVQDLLGVTGIGDKTFAALQPLVTV